MPTDIPLTLTGAHREALIHGLADAFVATADPERAANAIMNVAENWPGGLEIRALLDDLANELFDRAGDDGAAA